MRTREKIARIVAAATVCLFLLGCSEDADTGIQSQTDHPSPDGKYIATVAQKLAEATTGTIPELYLRQAGATRPGAIHVLDGDLNGLFQVSWTGTRDLLVEYSAGEGWLLRLPSATNVDGITIALRKTPYRQ